MRRRHAVLFLLILLLIAGSAFGQGDSKSPHVVGAICSLTGRDARMGMSQRDALFWLAEYLNARGGINGHPLRVIVEDDASDGTMAVKAAKKLIEQDVASALIGSSGTPATLAVMPIIEAAGVSLVSMADGVAVTSPFRRWVFRAAPSAAMEAFRILLYLGSQGIHRVGVLYESDGYGTSGRDQVRAMALKYNMTIAAEATYRPEDTDMIAQLSRLRATGSQGIIAWGTNPSLATVARSAEKLQIGLVMMNSRAADGPDLLVRAGSASERVVLPAGRLLVADVLPDSDPQKKLLRYFASEYWRRFNRPADAYAGYAWDALHLITTAYQKTGDKRANVRDELERSIYTGVTGFFKYSNGDHDGLLNSTHLMVRASRGRWVIVAK